MICFLASENSAYENALQQVKDDVAKSANDTARIARALEGIEKSTARGRCQEVLEKIYKLKSAGDKLMWFYQSPNVKDKGQEGTKVFKILIDYGMNHTTR